MGTRAMLMFGLMAAMIAGVSAQPPPFGGTSTPNAPFGDPYALNPFQMQTVCDVQEQVGLPIFPTICGWPTYTVTDFFDIQDIGPIPPFRVWLPRGTIVPFLPQTWP